jgi:hypothetical protein
VGGFEPCDHSHSATFSISEDFLMTSEGLCSMASMGVLGQFSVLCILQKSNCSACVVFDVEDDRSIALVHM